MGLDMYFTPISFNDGMYLRKASAIHNYIVETHANGIDECQIIELSRDDLEELRNRCTDVLSDRSLAPDLLPTTPGFFFGDLEYNDWYFEQLERFEKECTAMLGRKDWDYMQYQASW